MKTIFDQSVIERTIRRLSYEIIEKNKDLSLLTFLGIPTRGVTLAKRIQKNIEQIEGVLIPVEILNVSGYRDDDKKTEEKNLPDTNLDNRVCILVDDVLFTGRTVRAAMDAIIDLGRPSKVHLVVLVDRGHREFPIHANYVGKNLPTSILEKVYVHFMEDDGIEDVVLG
ncbi:bifunctional pyr operon transcriptional regulator/uracil phosphoribosyltransferase PyrR [Peloplasma aerotolerans]|jgi:pyrimidine operon attenuation protein / uracil phosphoribosyltransferase|uniref:Bifunctional protein PyrR n=1 Tax=Peloplasma aerotolerans TaxID=3044389 RepID=A0AAW6U2K3_9MOLU|nr:bifunctional pyr operon transcriptional regulator/uracil phosphoribosyltransferase PyrR [Mariniplasma sp. M4Ah]MDI6452117.1 bifunctional pyr operon transcriptional regulator/uracil phosphoribosyltransferase PyrR [Mariniplasma sp. M4Ah]